MATGQITFAELETPPAPGGRVHFAKVAIPGITSARVHFAKFTSPPGSIASGSIHFASLKFPASPDAMPASGLFQLASNGAWWNTSIRQKTANDEWV